MRSPKRDRVFSAEQEKIWKAWRPLMHLPPHRATAAYLQLRDEVGKLTVRGCDLAFLFAMAKGYATLRLLESLHRGSQGNKKLSKSEKISRYLVATRDQSVKKAEDLAVVLEVLQKAIARLKLPPQDLAGVLAAFDGLNGMLHRYCKAMKQAHREENRASELRTWRRAYLVQLVDHVKAKGVKHLWKPVAALVSCSQPKQVTFDYVEQPPYFRLSQDPDPLQRHPNQLRQEYEAGLDLGRRIGTATPVRRLWGAVGWDTIGPKSSGKQRTTSNRVQKR